MANKNFPQNPVELKVSAGSRRCLAVYVQLGVLVGSSKSRHASDQPEFSTELVFFHPDHFRVT